MLRGGIFAFFVAINSGQGVGFPDGDVLFEAVHEGGEEGEGGGAVSGLHGDVDGGFSDGDGAGAVLDEDGVAGMLGGEFGEEAAGDGFGHRLLGFVNEGGDGVVVFGASDRAGERGYGTDGGINRECGRCDDGGGDEDFDVHARKRNLNHGLNGWNK